MINTDQVLEEAQAMLHEAKGQQAFAQVVLDLISDLKRTQDALALSNSQVVLDLISDLKRTQDALALSNSRLSKVDYECCKASMLELYPKR